MACDPEGSRARSTVYDYFDRWNWDGTLRRIHHALYAKCREEASRQASPTAAIIDAQSVKSAEKGGAHIDPHGYDAGKKVKGKKRHVLVDTQGLMLHAIVTAADIQDRDGGAWLLGTLFGLYQHLCGTGGFLISAMQHMLRKAVTEEERRDIKRNRLIGIENSPKMFALAASNMILRGDGKANLHQSSCFDDDIISAIRKMEPNVGMLNPPYAQSKSDAELHELIFCQADA